MSGLEEFGSKVITVGPWGGDDGMAFDDGVYSNVRQIVINHGNSIDSIQIEYDDRGASVWSNKHGGRGGFKTDTVKLAYPDEYLISINGYCGKLTEWGPPLVRSLTLKSNKKVYGPFGVELGTGFSTPTYKNGVKIVGFHGIACWSLDAIGVHLSPIDHQNRPMFTVNGYPIVPANSAQIYDHDLTNKVVTPVVKGAIKCGPWGGTSGTAFDDGVYTGVKEISISRNVGIVYIKVLYDQNGKSVWGDKLGGTGGFKNDKVIFDYPREVLTHITGTFGAAMIMGPNVIKSLTFYTNTGKHGPFGEEQGSSFTSRVKQGKIVGFHGRKGLFLDAIGVYVLEDNMGPKPISTSPNFSTPIVVLDQRPSYLVASKQVPNEVVALGMVKEPAPCGPGPWGGEGGQSWDDGVFSDIKQIYLTRVEDAICSIQIEYDRNGQSIWSTKHGSDLGRTTHRIKLEYPHEVLIRISGYWGSTRGEKQRVIRSLTFYSSVGQYGPFGEEIGSYFSSAMTQGKVVGFHGRSSLYLDAIGVHMQHWISNFDQPLTLLS